LITATCHCAPPDNKPLPEEITNCSSYLRAVLGSREWEGVLCLGGIAWKQVHAVLGTRCSAFGHGVVRNGSPRLVASYHPSQQNTFTGRLTEQMLDDAIATWLS
jgi:uracil-DNA glycosylase